MRQQLQGLIRSQSLTRDQTGRLLRERAGVTLHELAAVVGVDAATLSRWERGQTRPRPAAALRWLAACQIIENELREPPDRYVENSPGLHPGAARTPSLHSPTSTLSVRGRPRSPESTRDISG